jgi:hypothetical protein
MCQPEAVAALTRSTSPTRSVHDVFDRPVCSAPGPFITIKLRAFERLRVEIPLTGATKRCLNLGSYNYLGFATTGGAEDQVYKSLEDHSVSTCSTRSELVRLPACSQWSVAGTTCVCCLYGCASVGHDAGPPRPGGQHRGLRWEGGCSGRGHGLRGQLTADSVARQQGVTHHL